MKTDITILEAWAMPLKEEHDKTDPRMIIRVIWTSGRLKGDLLVPNSGLRLRAKKNMATWWMPVAKFKQLCATFTQRELALLTAVRMLKRPRPPLQNPFLPKRK